MSEAKTSATGASTHEVLLTGSIPRQPAAEAFRAAQSCLGEHVRRLPDGEQSGWLFGVAAAYAQNPALEEGTPVPFTDADTWFSSGEMPQYHLREGKRGEDLTLTLTAMVESTRDSYRQFRELKEQGVIAAQTRFQATVLGPVTNACPLDVPATFALPALEAMVVDQVEAVVTDIPAEELTVQFDLATEVELDEDRRAPDAFVAWFLDKIEENWSGVSISEIVASVARVADTVPEPVELGFHLCSMWHIDPRGGQDLQVHVDWANWLTERTNRRIDYIHMPIIPEHGPEDFAKLSGLKLAPETKLFLGVIHTTDGIDGARRRIEAARQVVPDFGVAHFCGLAPVFGIDPDKLDGVLELHRAAAEV